MKFLAKLTPIECVSIWFFGFVLASALSTSGRQPSSWPDAFQYHFVEDAAFTYPFLISVAFLELALFKVLWRLRAKRKVAGFHDT